MKAHAEFQVRLDQNEQLLEKGGIRRVALLELLLCLNFHHCDLTFLSLECHWGKLTKINMLLFKEKDPGRVIAMLV